MERVAGTDPRFFCLCVPIKFSLIFNVAFRGDGNALTILNMSIRRCGKCGYEVTNDQMKFCEECGAALPPVDLKNESCTTNVVDELIEIRELTRNINKQVAVISSISQNNDGTIGTYDASTGDNIAETYLSYIAYASLCLGLIGSLIAGGAVYKPFVAVGGDAFVGFLMFLGVMLIGMFFSFLSWALFMVLINMSRNTRHLKHILAKMSRLNVEIK